MDIQLTITLSDQLFALLEDKLPNLGRRVESALTKELGRTLRSESEITITATGTPTPRRKHRPVKKRKAKETAKNAENAEENAETDPKQD